MRKVDATYAKGGIQDLQGTLCCSGGCAISFEEEDYDDNHEDGEEKPSEPGRDRHDGIVSRNGSEIVRLTHGS